MADLFADALDSKIESHYKHKKIDRYDHDLLGHYIDVEMAPTIDAVQVVRCGMCKHWTACESEENDCDIYGVCNQIGRLTIFDWFAQTGRRRRMRLIDADALREKCGDWYVEEGPEEGFIGTFKSLIDEQPTVDAAPVVHGRWLDIVKTDTRLRECSVCHDWQVHSEAYIPNYCPNCGAKMDGDGDAR